MEQTVIRRLKPGTLAAFKAAAKVNGRSLEAELRALLEANLPKLRKDSAALLRLSDEALATTSPAGPGPVSDSTDLIRWDRDTNGGRDADHGRTDDVGG